MSRRPRQNDATVTLFPFLAVLICTMGALIVLLVVVVQQASNVSPDPATALAVVESEELHPDMQREQELQQQHDDLRWQAEMIAKSREETRRQLQAQQVELSRSEDLIRQTKSELDRLYLASENLQALNDDQDMSIGSVQTLQAELETKISDAARRLAEAQDAAERMKQTYALVAYDGPSGTQRKPIYIECLHDRILIQPEGVTLGTDDFLPPIGVDNVLASAVRAIREYYVNNGIVRSSTEPYPLIIVRPEGASAFAACRGALQNFDDEFGYELLPDDIKLAYPRPDPGLKALLLRTVEEARWRLQRTRAPQSKELTLSIDSKTGGFVRSDEGRGSEYVGASPGGSGSGGGGSAPTNNQDSLPTTGVAEGALGVVAGAVDSAGVSLGGTLDGSDGNSPAGQSTGGAGGTLASGAMSGAAGGASTDSASSIAVREGANWALPGAANGSIPIQRPVAVNCTAHSLDLLPEPGTTQEAVSVPWQYGAESAVREMVSALWTRIEGWGIAGAGAYWKPVIEVSVDPAAEATYHEIVALLEDSGITVTRK